MMPSALKEINMLEIPTPPRRTAITKSGDYVLLYVLNKFLI